MRTSARTLFFYFDDRNAHTPNGYALGLRSAALGESTAAVSDLAPLPGAHAPPAKAPASSHALASWNQLRYAPRANSSANPFFPRIFDHHRLERIKSARSQPYAAS
jgi:hypothetical protein